MVRVRVLFAIVLLVPGLLFAEALPQSQGTATVRGTVLDRADGTPIEDVSVRIQDALQAVKTDASGRFELLNIEPGRRTIYVSIVGFILVKRPVVVAAGETIDVVIALASCA